MGFPDRRDPCGITPKSAPPGGWQQKPGTNAKYPELSGKRYFNQPAFEWVFLRLENAVNAVHQTFAPFLASICPPPPMPSVRPDTSRVQAQCDAQAAIIKRMQPPKVPIGQVEYVHRFGVMELVCHLEYEEAEPADGTSPAIAASAELIAAYANGMDVSEVLDAATVGLIQIKAAASLEE